MTKKGLAALRSTRRPARAARGVRAGAVRRSGRLAAVAEGPPIQRGHRHSRGRPRAPSRRRRRSRLRLELVPIARTRAGFVNSAPTAPTDPGARLPHHSLALPVDSQPAATRGQAPRRAAERPVSMPGSTRRTASSSGSRAVPPRPSRRTTSRSSATSSGAADARLEIAPERPFGAALFANYARIVMPTRGDGGSRTSRSTATTWRPAPRSSPSRAAERSTGTSATSFHDTLFEESAGQPYTNIDERGLHARALEVPASHGAHLRRRPSVHQLHQHD